MVLDWDEKMSIGIATVLVVLSNDGHHPQIGMFLNDCRRINIRIPETFTIPNETTY